jgi:hypothetical protein
LHPGIEHPQDEVKEAMIADLHFGPRLGIERCGKINSVNSDSDNCTGMGVISGFLAVVLMMEGPHVKKVDPHGSIPISPHRTRG